MGNNDVTMSNNNLLDPECCFARSVAQTSRHSCTWFCVMSFIANCLDAARIPPFLTSRHVYHHPPPVPAQLHKATEMPICGHVAASWTRTLKALD